MIKVFHFTINHSKYKEEFATLNEHLKNLDYVKSSNAYSHFLSFKEIVHGVEKKVKNKDALLIHPGIWGQETIIEEFPEKFPKLEIALLADNVGKYHVETRGKLHFFNYKDLSGIDKFLYSIEKTKNRI